VRPSTRALSMLPRVDYADSFFVERAIAPDQEAEAWARSFFENAPAPMRAALPRGWMSLGLKVGSPSAPELVFGWTVRRATPDLVLLGAESRVGMPGELLFMRQGAALVFATFLHHKTLLTRSVWAGIAPRHRRIVRHLLEHAAA
jgi:hypothetical protein